jgi:predicted RNA-binding protein Jag
MDRDLVLQTTKEFVNDLAKLMLLDDPDYRTELVDGELTVFVDYKGENMGFMIGPRGRFLQSLQSVILTFLRKTFPDEKLSVIVDAGDYLAAKIERIRVYALAKADDARILGEDIDLDPMTAFERKMVHSILSKFDDLKTESFGEGEDRYVRIQIVKDELLGIGESANQNTEEKQEE